MEDFADLTTFQPGQLLARGVCRHLITYDFVCVEELTPTRGRRVDV
ncbi:MAG: DNA repair protein MmcB-related protein, partial [Pseudomonadota bacterium]